MAKPKQLDRIENTLTNVQVTLAGQAVSIKEHIHRTNLLEVSVDVLKTESAARAGMAKVGSVALAVAGVTIALVEVLYHVKHL